MRRRERQFGKNRPVGIRVRKERQELPIPGPFRKLPDKALCPFVGSEVYPRVEHQLEPVQRGFVILLGEHPVRQKHRDKEEQFPVVNRSRRPPAEIDRRRRIGFRNDAAWQVTVFEQRLRQIPGLPVARRVVAEIDAEIVVVVRIGIIVAVRDGQSLCLAAVKPFRSALQKTPAELARLRIGNHLHVVVRDAVRPRPAVSGNGADKEDSLGIHIEERPVLVANKSHVHGQQLERASRIAKNFGSVLQNQRTSQRYRTSSLQDGIPTENDSSQIHHK